MSTYGTVTLRVRGTNTWKIYVKNILKLKLVVVRLCWVQSDDANTLSQVLHLGLEKIKINFSQGGHIRSKINKMWWKKRWKTDSPIRASIAIKVSNVSQTHVPEFKWISSEISTCPTSLSEMWIIETPRIIEKPR